MSEAKRSVNEATFRAVFAAICDGEYESIAQHVTEDFWFELPFAPEGIPSRIDGREPWDTMQRRTFKMFERFTNTIDAVYPGADPDLIIAEYHSEAPVKHNGNTYRNRYVGVFHFRDGKICGWREYHDPTATSVLM